MGCVSSWCNNGYLLSVFDSEFPRVGVLGEVDVKAGVVSLCETVLDEQRSCAIRQKNSTSELVNSRSGNGNSLNWFVSISCNSFRVWATAQLASAVCGDCGGDEVGCHVIQLKRCRHSNTSTCCEVAVGRCCRCINSICASRPRLVLH
jgi:hypothetical protein